MKRKEWLSLGILMLAGLFVLAGCSQKTSPVQASGDAANLAAVLATSGYTNSDGFGGTNDGTSDPQGFLGSGGRAIPGWDTLPPVRFARNITRNLRTVRIDSMNAEKTKAWVTITHDRSGNFFVNAHPGDPHYLYVRPIEDDQWIRHAYLEKKNGEGEGRGEWRVMAISPADIRTVNSPYPITILSVEATATPSGAHYVFTRPDTLLARGEMPAFQPGDQVTLRVTVSVQGDSSWAFLHRWAKPFPSRHNREAFYKTSTNTFERTWKIEEDDVSQTPAIRHSAVDLIGWQTLFGDAQARYNAHAWAFLYVVKEPSEQDPE